ncbi:hypothetical protein ACFV5D_25495, partial [Streptomyces clavifer]
MDASRLPRRLLSCLVSVLALATLSTGMAQGAPAPVEKPPASTAAAAAAGPGADRLVAPPGARGERAHKDSPS